MSEAQLRIPKVSKKIALKENSIVGLVKLMLINYMFLFFFFFHEAKSNIKRQVKYNCLFEVLVKITQIKDGHKYFIFKTRAPSTYWWGGGEKLWRHHNPFQQLHRFTYKLLSISQTKLPWSFQLQTIHLHSINNYRNYSFNQFLTAH